MLVGFPVRLVTAVRGISQFSAEGLVQQRLLQRVQRGELLLVDGFEALGFFAKSINHVDDHCLLGNRQELADHSSLSRRIRLEVLLTPLQRSCRRQLLCLKQSERSARKCGFTSWRSTDNEPIAAIRITSSQAESTSRSSGITSSSTNEQGRPVLSIGNS